MMLDIQGRNGRSPTLLIIFGATGDLAQKKLFPALFRLHRKNQLPKRFTVIGLGRSISGEGVFRAHVRESLSAVIHPAAQNGAKGVEAFLSLFRYLRMDVNEAEGFQRLKTELDAIDNLMNGPANRIFYLAVGPESFSPIVRNLSAQGVLETSASKRIVVEKPFGTDLESAARLNRELSDAFAEREIYRIDHYLGKSMLQNTMAIRFSNSVFEPLWNNRFIDSIQITAAEKDGIGARGRYYEQSGALRDMVQNHLMQLLAIVAMEPPVDLSPESIRDEKVKVIKSLRRFDRETVRKCTVRGQYGPGEIDGEHVCGYRQEKRVASDSPVETYAALQLFIDNWRWAGVPFYLRTGKRLARRFAEIVIQFKPLPGILYFQGEQAPPANVLVIRIQPEEGVFFRFNARDFGSGSQIVPVEMQYCQNCEYPDDSPEAYETLLRDIIAGDTTLFTRWDEVESTWRFIQDISRVWEESEPKFPNYSAGSWGPAEAEELLKADGRKWWDSK